MQEVEKLLKILNANKMLNGINRMKYLKQIDVIIFVLIVIAFFWYVPVKQFPMLKGVMGGMNIIPPHLTLNKYKDIKNTSKYLDELGEICKGYPPNSIAILWEDYTKVIVFMMNREDIFYSYMMYERFYDINKNPARVCKDKREKMDQYLVLLSTSSTYDKGLFVSQTEHFGLVERANKK